MTTLPAADNRDPEGETRHSGLPAAIRQAVVDEVASADAEGLWERPLVGFAAVADPLMSALKRMVSPTHLLPGDLLPSARTVIVYFIPFVKAVPQANRGRRAAAPQWARAYIETNRLVAAVNDGLSALLGALGFDQVVLPATHNFDTERLVADWSHKHLAYIAGLGAFGVHRLLITAKGCCGRFGSLITSAAVPATARSGRERCLHRETGDCLACVRNCVFGALTAERFDRQACYRVLLANAARFEKMGLADVCGKCTCVVPCSFVDPVQELVSKKKPNDEPFARP